MARVCQLYFEMTRRVATVWMQWAAVTLPGEFPSMCVAAASCIHTVCWTGYGQFETERLSDITRLQLALFASCYHVLGKSQLPSAWHYLQVVTMRLANFSYRVLGNLPRAWQVAVAAFSLSSYFLLQLPQRRATATHCYFNNYIELSVSLIFVSCCSHCPNRRYPHPQRHLCSPTALPCLRGASMRALCFTCLSCEVRDKKSED